MFIPFTIFTAVYRTMYKMLSMLNWLVQMWCVTKMLLNKRPQCYVHTYKNVRSGSVQLNSGVKSSWPTSPYIKRYSTLTIVVYCSRALAWKQDFFFFVVYICARMTERIEWEKEIKKRSRLRDIRFSEAPLRSKTQPIISVCQDSFADNTTDTCSMKILGFCPAVYYTALEYVNKML